MRNTAALFLVVLAPFALAAAVRSFSVPTTAMEPTIVRGEHIAVDDGSYERSLPKRGDIVAYRNPKAPDVVMAKRVVGLPLETVEIRHKVLYVNNRILPEPYVVHTDETDLTGATEEPSKSRDQFGPIKLAMNEYFILGDNRDSSYDSRYHGPISSSLLVGRVVKVRGTTGDREVK